MQAATEKAGVLVEALGWIRRFRDRLVVIKLGGSTLDEPRQVQSLLTDFMFMEAVRMRPVVVHGGGKAINAAMAQAGLVPTFVQGRRYTDRATLEIVARVLAGDVCRGLVREIEQRGGRGVALSPETGANCLTAERLTLTDAEGMDVDLGYVGRVVEVDRERILEASREGVIPILPSVGQGRDGQKYNINADTAAAAVARSLDAEKLVFISDVPGICLDRTRPESLVSQLTAARCRELIADGVIAGGMVPKVEAALEALDAGVKKVHIVDGRVPHSLLAEIYSDRGVGTEIVP